MKKLFTVEIASDRESTLKIVLQFSKIESAREYAKNHNGIVLEDQRKAA